MFRYRKTVAALSAAALLGSASVAAQDCQLPGAFGPALGAVSQTEWFGGTGTNCALRAQLTSAIQSSRAAGFVAYSYPAGHDRTRIRFTLDLGQLDLADALRYAGVLSIAGTAPSPGQPGMALQLHVGGDPAAAGDRRLIWTVAGPAGAGDTHRSVPLGSATIVHVGIDLQLGSNGYFAYWLDSDFSTPPSGRVPASGFVDLSARAPLGGLSLGLFSGSGTFRTNNVAKNLVISQISVDDSLFRSTFE